MANVPSLIEPNVGLRLCTELTPRAKNNSSTYAPCGPLTVLGLVAPTYIPVPAGWNFPMLPEKFAVVTFGILVALVKVNVITPLVRCTNQLLQPSGAIVLPLLPLNVAVILVVPY